MYQWINKNLLITTSSDEHRITRPHTLNVSLIQPEVNIDILQFFTWHMWVFEFESHKCHFQYCLNSFAYRETIAFPLAFELHVDVSDNQTPIFSKNSRTLLKLSHPLSATIFPTRPYLQTISSKINWHTTNVVSTWVIYPLLNLYGLPLLALSISSIQTPSS